MSLNLFKLYRSVGLLYRIQVFSFDQNLRDAIHLFPTDKIYMKFSKPRLYVDLRKSHDRISKSVESLFACKIFFYFLHIFYKEDIFSPIL